MVYDSGATSSCRMKNDEFILTYKQSTKVFNIPTCTTTKSSVKSKMHYNLRDTSIKVNVVPALKYNSLMN